MEDCFHIGSKALIYNEKNELLLLGCSNYWDLPGGRIHKNETLKAALQREVFEETGITNLTNIQFLGLFLSTRRITKHDIGLIFALHHCLLESSPPITLSPEHTSYEWTSLPLAIPRLTQHYPPQLINTITTTQSFTSTI